jgi:hypothetical protein
MPHFSNEQLASPKMRLACADCDTDAGDGITQRQAVKAGWVRITEDPPAEIPVNRPLIVEHHDVFHWWTHLGQCPACQREGVESGLTAPED